MRKSVLIGIVVLFAVCACAALSGPMRAASVKELKEKLNKLLEVKFNGNILAAYRCYDANHDDLISKDELTNLFTDAKIGNVLTRCVWVHEVFSVVDKNGDGLLSAQEIIASLK